MSTELSKTYDPRSVENRIYKKWLGGNYFHALRDFSNQAAEIYSYSPATTMLNGRWDPIRSYTRVSPKYLPYLAEKLLPSQFRRMAGREAVPSRFPVCLWDVIGGAAYLAV